MSKKAKPKSSAYLVMGVRRSPLGWSVVKHMVQDGVIISTETSQPDLRDITLERLDVEQGIFWEPVN